MGKFHFENYNVNEKGGKLASILWFSFGLLHYWRQRDREREKAAKKNERMLIRAGCNNGYEKIRIKCTKASAIVVHSNFQWLRFLFNFASADEEMNGEGEEETEKITVSFYMLLNNDRWRK